MPKPCEDVVGVLGILVLKYSMFLPRMDMPFSLSVRRRKIIEQNG